jgi:hypothetical protein
VTDPGGALVVLDALGQSVERCAALSEWLCWAEVDDPDVFPVVQAGANAAGSLCGRLRRAETEAGDLWTPSGATQLDPLLILEGDARSDVAAVIEAGAVLAGEQLSEGPSFVAYLARCQVASDSDDGRVLATVPRSYGVPVRLTDREWLAYRRLVHAVLDDPLERFGATGLHAEVPDRPWRPQRRGDAPGHRPAPAPLPAQGQRVDHAARRARRQRP